MSRILIHKISGDFSEKPSVKSITEMNYSEWNFKEPWDHWERIGVCNLQATPIQKVKYRQIVWEIWLTGEMIKKPCVTCD